MSKDLRPNQNKRGFTLIEVLVAMAITALLILMANNIFSAASGSYNAGVERSEVEAAGRAALNFMSTKLSQAIVGLADPSSFYWDFNLTAGKDVNFYSAGDTIQLNRFYFDGTNLLYGYGTNNPAFLIDNVVDFKIYAYPSYQQLVTAQGDPFNCSFSTNLPYCVDISIKLISASDKKKADQLSGGSLADFLLRNGRWFTTRVYFQLRQGYLKHPYGQSDADR